MNKELVIADMHMHTAGPKGSDGRNSPHELVLAAREKLDGKDIQGAMALTDHDTVGNVREFFASCRENGIIAVGGIEISFKAELLDLRDRRIEAELTLLREQAQVIWERNRRQN